MHPILASRRRLVVYLLAWILIGVLLAAGLRGQSGWVPALIFFVPLGFAFALLSLSAWYICRAFPIGPGTTRWTVVVVHVLAAAVNGALWAAVAALWARAIDLVVGGQEGAFLGVQRPLLVVVGGLLFWLAVVFHYLLIAIDQSREAETRALELSLLAREAELKALRAQIDPHFIFNSLHSISALTAIDAGAARRMCLLLADFLRETLRLGASSRISLADEIALAERFLAIEQVRLGSRLHVIRDADQEAAACLVPPLFLQPLVENAVVHGVAQLVEGGTIRIAARRIGPMLTITLENPCDPDRAPTRGVGLGLELLKRRLTAQCGAYEAVQTAEHDGRFRVEVHIPVVSAA